jgi:hypothetical protein
MTKRRARQNKDLLDDVSEEAESEQSVENNLGKQCDILDYIVESAVCDEDSEDFDDVLADHRADTRAAMYIKRDNSLIDSSEGPQRGDVLVIRDERDELDHMCDAVKDECNADGFSESRAGNKVILTNLPDQIDSPKDILNRDRSLISESTCPSNHDPRGVVNRDRSLISESSLSSVGLSRDSMQENEPRSEGMELVLRRTERVPAPAFAPVRRPNRLSQFLRGSRSSDSVSMQSKQSRKTRKSEKKKIFSVVSAQPKRHRQTHKSSRDSTQAAF